MSEQPDMKKETAKKEAEGKAKAEKGSAKIAIVRVRGGISLSKDIKDTLNMLNLRNQNACSVFDDTASIRGMIKKVKDQVTWGRISDETLKLLDEKRGVKGKEFYRLNPPRKGFGRKGIKTHFASRGALGDRGDKINDLIQRMV